MTDHRLVSFLFRHALAGVAAGCTAAGALLWLDVGGIGTLVFASDLAPMPLLLLLTFFSLTFASVAMGAAIMGLGRDDPGGTRLGQARSRVWKPRGSGLDPHAKLAASSSTIRAEAP